MIEEKLIQLIKAEQAEIAANVFQMPAEDFAKHNRLVGMHQGLGKAIELLTGLMSSEDDET